MQGQVWSVEYWREGCRAELVKAVVRLWNVRVRVRVRETVAGFPNFPRFPDFLGFLGRL